MDLHTIATVLHPADRAEFAAWRPGDAWLGGGTWLFSEPQPHLDRLIDLAALGWPASHVSPAGLNLAATCTIAELVRLPLPPDWTAAPLVRLCCEALLGSFKIWNMATFGGNLCLALPAGPMIALASALDGICRIWAPDGSERALAVTEFVLGPQRTALAPGEVLRAVDIPAEALRRRASFRRASLTPLGRSGALLIGTLDARGAFALTTTASTPRPIRISLPHLPDATELAAEIARAVPDHLVFDDVHGRPDWRRHVTFALAEEIRAELAGDPGR